MDNQTVTEGWLELLDGLCATYLGVRQMESEDAFVGRGVVVPESQVTVALGGGSNRLEPHPGFRTHLDELQRDTEDSQEPLAILFRRLQATEFQRLAIVLAVAPELNRKYQRVFAYLQDNINEKFATIGLCADLFGIIAPITEDEIFALCDEGSPLCRYVLAVTGQSGRTSAAGLSRGLVLRQTALLWFTGADHLPDPLPAVAERFCGGQKVTPLTHMEQCQQATRFAQYCMEYPVEGQMGLLQIYGQPNNGRKFTLQYVAGETGRDVLCLDCEGVCAMSAESRRGAMEAATSWCWLHNGIIALYRFDFQKHSEQERGNLTKWFLRKIKGVGAVASICGECPLDIQYDQTFRLFQVDIPRHTIGEQRQFWNRFSQSAHLPLADGLDDMILANIYSLSPGQIRQVLDIAQNRSIAQGNHVITRQDIAEGVRLLCSPKLNQITQPITTTFTWDDLVLEEEPLQQLQKLCDRIRYRWQVNENWGFDKKLPYGKGVSVCLYGPPGTGKTMTAQVLANEFGLDAYRVDMSRIMDKYIGETEKKLCELFDTAKDSNAILFFDEADALFTKRTEVKESKDRYANVETAYLLQRMEDHNGISILATNAVQNFDDAFKRRITQMINVSMPNTETRRTLWHSVFPPEAPLKGVNLDFFAQRFELSGSSIKNIAVAAAFYAAAIDSPITRELIGRAVKEEYQKTGRVLMEHELY